MELETRESASAYFVTLTYDDKHRPGELRKDHLQGFFKRFRNYQRVRFFACGEYGDKFQREHYHAILWFKDRLPISVVYDYVERSWPFGFVQVKEANLDNMRYVAKYTIKQAFNVPKDKVPPFALMSRRPGIGADYFPTLQSYYHEYIASERGRKPLPRYFLDKLNPVEQVFIKRHRREFAESLPKLSDEQKFLREAALEQSLQRKYVRKHGRQRESSGSSSQ